MFVVTKIDSVRMGVYLYGKSLGISLQGRVRETVKQIRAEVANEGSKYRTDLVSKKSYSRDFVTISMEPPASNNARMAVRRENLNIFSYGVKWLMTMTDQIDSRQPSSSKDIAIFHFFGR